MKEQKITQSLFSFFMVLISRCLPLIHEWTTAGFLALGSSYIRPEQVTLFTTIFIISLSHQLKSMSLIQ